MTIIWWMLRVKLTNEGLEVFTFSANDFMDNSILWEQPLQYGKLKMINFSYVGEGSPNYL